VWRPDKSGWTQQDELLATVSETVDAWGRLVVLSAQRGPLKKPTLPPALVDLRHPDRPRRDATKASRPPVDPTARDDHGHARTRIDVAAARRFFGQQGIRSRR
jgi:hypothetical protein